MNNKQISNLLNYKLQTVEGHSLDHKPPRR